jgi:TonB-linked SusC/RagA family outer membrane protein
MLGLPVPVRSIRGRTIRGAAWTGLLTILALAPPAAAQQTGTISGQVRSQSDLSPLAGVQLLVEGTGIGGITNNLGRFVLVNVPAGEHTLTATMLGRRTAQTTVVVTPQGTTVANLELTEAAIGLDEIVVTGTAGAQQARALGTTVGSVEVSQLQEISPQASFESMLSAKIPGLNVAAGAGAVGGGSNVRIRGASSIVLSGQPLIFIDGVRVNSAGPGDDVTLGVGNSRPASRLNDISPETIESIEIIKGPAAATLYGTEASNGVINIITKRGSPGDPVFTMTAKVGQNWYPDPKVHWPGSYFTCTGTGTHGCQPGEIVYVNVFMEDYQTLGLEHFRTGLPRGLAGTLSGGTDRLRYHFTLDWDRDEGPVPTNDRDLLTARANLNWLPRPDISVDFGIGGIRSELHTDTGRQPARITGFHWSCPGAGCERGTGTPNALDGAFRGYIAYLPDMYDQYLDAGQNVNRYTYTLSANHRPTSWLSQRVIVGLDHTETQGYLIHRHTEGRVGISSRNGSKSVEYRTTQNRSFDYSVTATVEPVAGLVLATSTGAQYFEKTSEWLSGSGSTFAVPTLLTISAGEDRETSDGVLANKTVGMYVQEQISWQNRLFLTGALRGDDNSAFGAEYDFVLYPKLSASWVASEEGFLDGVGWLNSLRLRGAWGQAGQQPDQFAAVRLYSPEPGYNGIGGVTPLTFGNPEVEPEVGEEIELGFDAAVLDDRLGLEVTFYDQKRQNALLRIPVKPSTGFPGSQLRNIGEIQNRGLELVMNLEAFRGENVSIRLEGSAHLNSNEVTDLGGLDPIPVFGQNASTGWTGQRHVEGFPLGSIFEPRVVSAEIVGSGKNARAINVMCESGPPAWPGTRITRGGGPPVPCTAADAPEVYRGATIPTREFSFTPTVTFYDNLRLFASFDYVGGHHMVDGITAAAHMFFRNTKAIHERTDPILLGYEALGAIGSNQPGLFDASQLTMRNISLSYTLPQAWIARMGVDRVSVTLSGQDLWKVWRAQTHGFGQPIVDSEIRTTGGDASDPGGIAAYTQDGYPIFKRFLTTVRVTF